MKHIQKFKFHSIICILVILLSACSNELQNLPQGNDADIPTQETQYEKTDHNTTLSESHISTTLSSGAVVDAHIEIAPHINIDKLTTYSAEIVKLDYDLLKRLLLADKEILEEGSSEMADARTDALYHYCVTSEGSSLSYTGEGFSYSSENYALIQRILNSGDINLAQFSNLENLDFMPQKDALADIQSILDQLGITVNDTPTCYTLNSESLQLICDQINAIRKEATDGDFSLYTPLTCDETDACYIFIFQVTAEDLPISTRPNGIFGDGSWTSGTSLLCVYSQEGIIEMELPYFFKITGHESQVVKGLNADQVLEKLNNKLNSMILSGDYLVDNLAFEYVPMPINGSRSLFNLIPAWRLSITHTYQYQDEKNPGEMLSAKEEFDVVFNASTGEEIISNSGSI